METTTRSKGRLFIISAPSGAGKTTLCRRLLEYYPDIVYSISYTTRRPRPGEKDGKDYHFISREDFLEKRALDYWAEWARVHDHYYGTSAVFLSDSLARGRDVLMDIDVQGAMQILTRFPEAVTIFIMPPSLDALRQRLTQRGTDSHGTIQKRLRNAAEEMEKRELYRHIIVNDQLERAAEELLAVVKHCREGGT
ncbi:MAG: guanylate kinase [Thermodesulfobacteriota bacterium]